MIEWLNPRVLRGQGYRPCAPYIPWEYPEWLPRAEGGGGPGAGGGDQGHLGGGTQTLGGTHHGASYQVPRLSSNLSIIIMVP